MRTPLTLALAALLAVLAGCSGGEGASPFPTGSPHETATSQPRSTSSPSASPEPPSHPITAPFDLPVVMYHDVSEVAPNDKYRGVLNVTPGVFSAQLDYLKCAGFTTITPSRMADAIAGRRALPSRAVVLTFDDGYADHYTNAFPILKQHGMTGAFSIITGYLETADAYMTWPQVKEMARAGMEIMSHTVTHIDLNITDDADVQSQLRDSRSAIQQHTGQAPRFLVYPSGEPFRSGSAKRQAEVVAMVQTAGYSGAFLAGPSSTRQDPARQFAFNRLRVDGSVGLATYAKMVGGPSPDRCGGWAAASSPRGLSSESR